MKAIERYDDVIAGTTTKCEELFSLKNFPVNMLAETTTDPDKDIRFDMDFGINPATGIIQLVKLIPKDELYVDSHSNAVGSSWQGHREAVSYEIKKYSPENVFEIGGGSGLLEHEYNTSEGGHTKKWIILEPQPNPIHTNAEYIKGFFPSDLPIGLNFDMLVHTHLMEHMYSPRKFMEYIDPLMPVGRVMVFSVPNLKKLLEECATSVLNFEHTILLTEDYIEYLLGEFNYVIEDKKYYKDHSVIYACRKVKDNGFQHDSNEIKERFKSLCLQNRDLFMRYVKFHKDEIRKLNDYIMSVPENRDVYLFGAHITTQFYIAFGMNTDRMMLGSEAFS